MGIGLFPEAVCQRVPVTLMEQGNLDTKEYPCPLDEAAQELHEVTG